MLARVCVLFYEKIKILKHGPLRVILAQNSINLIRPGIIIIIYIRKNMAASRVKQI